MAFIFRGLVDVVTSEHGQKFAEKALWAVSFIIVSTSFRLLTSLAYASYIKKTMLFGA
ncbi:hypothetical protein D3C74_269420 [compost metagenome]